MIACGIVGAIETAAKMIQYIQDKYYIYIHRFAIVDSGLADGGAAAIGEAIKKNATLAVLNLSHVTLISDNVILEQDNGCGNDRFSYGTRRE